VRHRDDGSGRDASDILRWHSVRYSKRKTTWRIWLIHRRHSVRYSKRKTTIPTGICHGFLQSLQAYAGITSFNRPRRVPSTFIPIHSEWCKFSNFSVQFPPRKIILELCPNPLISKEILNENFTVQSSLSPVDVTLIHYSIHRHFHNICDYLIDRCNLVNRQSSMRDTYKLSHVGQDILIVRSYKCCFSSHFAIFWVKWVKL
jgi:hypothetical protein